jgi:hypothetical protein
MQTDNTARRGNLNLILCAIIAVMAIIIWFTNCSGKVDGNTVIETKEVKGGFPTVQGKDIEAKDIPIAPVVGQKVSGQKVSKVTPHDVENFKALYHLTQKQYDSLLVVNRTLDSLANSLYDKRLQPIIEACKFVEFKHELDNDTIHITLTGISRGVPQNLNTSYTIKARKQEIHVPTAVFTLLGGVEVGMTKTLSKFNTKANLGFQNKKGNILTISADTDQRFYLGYTAKIFSIKR